MSRQPSHAHCCEEVEPIDRHRLALALHDETDDCRFMFGGECDCSWGWRLDDAFDRYDNYQFPPPREDESW